MVHTYIHLPYTLVGIINLTHCNCNDHSKVFILKRIYETYVHQLYILTIVPNERFLLEDLCSFLGIYAYNMYTFFRIREFYFFRMNKQTIIITN